jgi:hypothetical protein
VLRNLMNLETLSLHGCKKLTDKSMSWVAKLPCLTSLDVGSTSILDAGVGTISLMPNLKHLSFASTKVSRDGFRSTSKMHHLTHLDAGGCVASTDECLINLKGLSGLLYLDISYWTMCLTSGGLDALINFPSLTYINLEGNETLTSADGMKALARLTSLQTLNLIGCPMVTDQSLSVLSSLQQLETLSLGAVAKARASQITTLVALHGLARLRDVQLIHCPRMTDLGLSALPKHVRVNHAYGCGGVKGANYYGAHAVPTPVRTQRTQRDVRA